MPTLSKRVAVFKLLSLHACRSVQSGNSSGMPSKAVQSRLCRAPSSRPTWHPCCCQVPSHQSPSCLSRTRAHHTGRVQSLLSPDIHKFSRMSAEVEGKHTSTSSDQTSEPAFHAAKSRFPDDLRLVEVWPSVHPIRKGPHFRVARSPCRSKMYSQARVRSVTT